MKIGQRVKWKAAGKVARLEGMAGKIATGVVEDILDDKAIVMPDHRLPKTADFSGMRAAVDLTDLLT